MTVVDDWRRVKDLFLQALEREPGEREALLSTVPDKVLAAEVSSLLAAHEEAGEFIQRPRVVGQSGLLEAITGTWAVGRKIGRYKVLRQLGRGTLGAVFQARDEERDEDVALELLAPEVQAFVSDTAVADLVARIGELDHPGLAGLREAGRTPEGLPYLIAEYVRGTQLPRHAEREELGLRERLALFRELLAAVASAHAHGIAHGDIKPRNVLVTSDGRVRLIDLGLSSLLAAPVRAALAAAPAGGPPRLPAGTTPYSSPEQVRGEAPSVASDLWALGALLYELLVGSPPHGEAAQSPERLKHAILGEDVPAPSEAGAEGVPLELDALAVKLLARDPARRPASVRDVDAALAAL
jgi:serine/threonine protein kinase